MIFLKRYLCAGCNTWQLGEAASTVQSVSVAQRRGDYAQVSIKRERFCLGCTAQRVERELDAEANRIGQILNDAYTIIRGAPASTPPSVSIKNPARTTFVERLALCWLRIRLWWEKA